MSKNDMRASIDKSEGVERRELGNVQKNNQVSTSVSFEKADRFGHHFKTFWIRARTASGKIYRGLRH